MKKDRNSFFSQYGVSAYNTNQPFMYPNGFPNQAGMNPPGAMNVPQGYAMPAQNQNPNMQIATVENEIDARLNKIEREIQRLDSRITKLEAATSNTNISNNDYNFANSMYMV